MNMINISINGFGRIGRAAFKILQERDDVTVVAINDLGDINDLAYLLRYDSVYGRYGKNVAVEGDELVVDDKRSVVLSQKNPELLPWDDLDVDVVIESTGFFTKEEGARKHLLAGAKKVIISAPSKSEGIVTVVKSVNDESLSGQSVVSNASCTTNCVTPVMAILEESFGIDKALLTTTHAYTATQNLVDGPDGKDQRRGRAGALNIVPSSTGAALASARALPSLVDRFDGVSVRVPVPVVSLIDCVCLLKKEVTSEEVNSVYTAAAQSDRFSDILGVTDEPVTSSDFIGDPRSAIVDLSLTRVVGSDLVKVMAWYDNEWGYSNRLVEQAIALVEAE